MPLTAEQKVELDKIKFKPKTAKITLGLMDKIKAKIIASHYDLDELEQRLEEIRIIRKRIDGNTNYKPFKKSIIHLAQIAHTRITVEKKALNKEK